MTVKEIVSDSYFSVKPFEGVNKIKNKLLEQKYVVVIDDESNYHGILTPCDLVRRPYKLVVDCLTQKNPVSADEPILTVVEKFDENHCPALPIFQDERFVGVVEQSGVIKWLKSYIEDLYNKSLISEKVKNLFLHNLYHEIRTPLNGILGFLDLLTHLDKEKIQLKGELYFQKMNRGAKRFLSVMNDLIEYSLIHAGKKADVAFDEVIVPELFSDLKTYFEHEAIYFNRDITIDYHIPNKDLKLSTDSKKLKQILFSLIDNAVKFSNDGQVHYCCEQDNETQEYVFSVKNTSDGIPADIKHKIFDIFEKAEDPEKPFTRGLGVGLALSAKLANIMGGQLSFKENNGEIFFYFVLPVSV